MTEDPKLPGPQEPRPQEPRPKEPRPKEPRPKEPRPGAKKTRVAKAERPSFVSIYMNLAFLLAERATCTRLNVGTVITTKDYRKVLAVGYNGNASGLPNRCDSNVPGSCGCLHSEENAVINCDSPRHIPKIVFVTHLPCKYCAKRLINLGFVEQVYYCHSYRSTDSIELFDYVGIGLTQVPPPTVAGHSPWEL